jgi:hypothetical protein
MSNPLTDEERMSPANNLSSWDEIRRLADELELKIHLAGMDARVRWQSIAPRLTVVEQRMKDTTQRVGKAVADELESLWKALRGLRDDVPNDN